MICLSLFDGGYVWRVFLMQFLSIDIEIMVLNDRIYRIF